MKTKPTNNRKKEFKFKEVQFWEPEDNRKQQFLVSFRDGRDCRVLEKIT